MKRKIIRVAAVLILFGMAGCTTMEREFSSLKEWRRSYLPTRNG